MSVHLLGASLSLATDRGSVLKLALDNLRQNAALIEGANGGGKFACCSLDWSEVQDSGVLPAELRSMLPFDVFLAADCLYYHRDRARALLATLVRLLAACPAASVLLCQSYRGAPDVEQLFFDEASASGLRAVLISQDAALSPDRKELEQMDVCIWRLWREADPSPQLPPPPATAPPDARNAATAVRLPAQSSALAASLTALVELRRCDGRTQWAFAATSCYAVCPIAGKGLGLVATYDLERGACILAEPPLVHVHWHVDRAGRADLAQLDRQVGGLAAAAREDYFSLCDVHGAALEFDHESGRIRGSADGAEARIGIGIGGDGSGGEEKSVAGIYCSNSFALDPGDCFTPCGDGMTHAGVFKTASRLNHSCRPCTFAAWNPAAGLQTVHALRDIRAGTELAHSYLGGVSFDGRRDNRRAQLSRKYRFDCDCEACQYQGEDLAQSEQRVRRMSELRAHLSADDDDGACEPADVLGCVEELWRLADEEGLPSVWLRALVIEAMQCAREQGKAADALEWASRGAQSAREALGANSPTTTKFDAIVRAWKHALTLGKPLPG